MDAKIVDAGGFDVIGISVRTTNKAEMSANGKIPAMWGRFIGGQIIDKIPNRTGGDIVVLYYDYQSDRDGEYSYLIGAPVKSIGTVPDGMSAVKVPAGNTRSLLQIVGLLRKSFKASGNRYGIRPKISRVAIEAIK